MWQISSMKTMHHVKLNSTVGEYLRQWMEMELAPTLSYKEL